MGTCASVYSRSECSAVKASPPPDTVVDKFEIPPSPIKPFKFQNNTESVIYKDISIITHHQKTLSGSKDEAFFDSQVMFDSDCEEFFSVKGDFTPSCGNTPLHRRFPSETLRASKAGANSNDSPSNFISPPLSAKRRKNLADLFQESPLGDARFAFLYHVHDDNRQVDEPSVSGSGSVCNSERTAGAGGIETPLSTFVLPPLPANRRKKLADLFRENLVGGASFAFLNQVQDDDESSGTGSICSREKTAVAGGDESVNEIPIGFKSKLCCLPPLVWRHNSGERKEDLKVGNGVS